MIDVGARQAALNAERDSLKTARTGALIDGREFDGHRIAEIDTEIAALGDVELEIARRTSQQAKDEAERLHDFAVAVVHGRETERYVELVRAQQHATGLAEALARFKKLTDEQVAALDGLGLNAPLSHRPAQVDRRLSQLLVVTLLSTLSKTWGFGNIEWGSAPPEARVAWPDYEKTACELALETVLNPSPGDTDVSTAA